MIKNLIQQSPLLGYYTFALALFVGVFAAVVVRVFTTKKSVHDEHARLALGDEEQKGGA